jgi:hypothetical protein
MTRVCRRWEDGNANGFGWNDANILNIYRIIARSTMEVHSYDR